MDDTVAVWEEFKDLATKYDCISLGEGSSGFSPPQFLVDELITAIREGAN